MTVFVLTSLIIGGSVYFTYVMRPANARQAINQLVGWFVVFVTMVIGGSWAFPMVFSKTQTQVANNWLPIVGDASQAVGSLGFQTGLWGNGAGNNSSMDYYYHTQTPYTPPQGYQMPTVPNVPQIPAVGGSVPPVAYTPQITITAEMQILFGYYTELAEAETQGDRTKGRAVVQSILSIAPNDVTGLSAQDKLNQSETVLTTRKQFFGSIGQSFFADDGLQAQVRQMLAGGNYVVLNDGAMAWTSACKETATIQETTPGWLFGTTYSLPRCYINQFGTATTGSTFTVR